MKNWVFKSVLVAVAFSMPAENLIAQIASPSDSAIVSASRALKPRKLANGIMTVVASDQDSEDTALGPFDLDFVAKHPELGWTAPDFPESKPHYASPAETLLALSKDVVFRHDVWGLQFSFKPARLIEVDVPLGNGKFKKKVVWYILYKVQYLAEDLVPKVEAEVPDAPEKVRFESVRFLPRFSLLSKERNISIDAQILPTALEAIAAKERIGKPLYDHVEIGKFDIAESTPEDDKSFWGAATWTDVDPRIDFFAIDVRGLTNAYKIRIDSDGKKNFDRKTLRIYFWRPGDVIDEAKDRILLGMPAFENKDRVDYYLKQYNLKERLDYQWIYR